MIDFPNAKINIGLFVTGKRADGYHNLETVFYPVQLSDVLEFTVADTFSFSFSGITVPGDQADNSVEKAYRLLKIDYHLPPVAIHLHKAIPFGAGLGGGSADGAFMLKMLNAHFQLGLNLNQLKTYAGRLGADCPFFIENQPAIATDTGGNLSPVSLDLSGYSFILIKPPFSVSTREAYAGIRPASPPCHLPETIRQAPECWKEVIKNDFENHIFLRHPEIGKIKETLYDLGAVYASMSGSGSAVYGIFRSVPDKIEKNFPVDYFIHR